MKPTPIKEILTMAPIGQAVVLNGWVRTFRSNRFIALNDGSSPGTVQCVVDFDRFDPALLRQVNTGAALKITGTLVESQGKGQNVEVMVNDIYVHGGADPET